LLRWKRKTVLEFFAQAGKPVAAITPLDVQAWRAALERRGLSANTIYARLSFVSSFFEWLLRDTRLGAALRGNPVRLARPKAPKAYQTEAAKALSDEQLRRLWEVLKAHAAGGEVPALRDHAIFLFLALSGMRRAEVLGLRGQDLLPDEEGLIVEVRVKGGELVRRRLAQPAVWEALSLYLEKSGRAAVLRTGGPLWVRHDPGREAAGGEKALAEWSFARRMKAYAAEAGLPHFHLHQTRHTFARIVAEKSQSLQQTQEALGHKHLATTRAYVRRLAIQPDRFGEEIARRLKL
jgi:integrase